MSAVVHRLPGATEPPYSRPSLNLRDDELVEASGGYHRPADQLKALHARGFVRAWRGPSGRVVLERAHYDAVVRGEFGRAPSPSQVLAADYRRLEAQSAEALAAAKAAAWERDAPLRAEAAARKAAWQERRTEERAALVRFHAAKRRSAKLLRTPAWADRDAMLAIYLEARRRTRETGIQHHVDHQIPLQGEFVSGLHVHNNLQVITGSENSRKKNRYSGDL